MHIKTIANLSRFLELSERQTKRIIDSGGLPKTQKGWDVKTVSEFKKLYSLKKSELIGLILKHKNTKNKSHSELRELRSMKEDLTVVSIENLQLV